MNEPVKMCCQSMVPSCLACSENKSVEDYCIDNPQTPGCDQINSSKKDITTIILVAIVMVLFLMNVL